MPEPQDGFPPHAAINEKLAPARSGHCPIFVSRQKQFGGDRCLSDVEHPGDQYEHGAWSRGLGAMLGVPALRDDADPADVAEAKPSKKRHKPKNKTGLGSTKKQLPYTPSPHPALSPKGRGYMRQLFFVDPYFNP